MTRLQLLLLMVLLKCLGVKETIMCSHTFVDGKDVKETAFTANNGLIRCITFNKDATKIFCGCENGDILLLSTDGLMIFLLLICR